MKNRNYKVQQGETLCLKKKRGSERATIRREESAARELFPGALLARPPMIPKLYGTDCEAALFIEAEPRYIGSLGYNLNRICSLRTHPGARLPHKLAAQAGAPASRLHSHKPDMAGAVCDAARNISSRPRVRCCHE